MWCVLMVCLAGNHLRLESQVSWTPTGLGFRQRVIGGRSTELTAGAQQLLQQLSIPEQLQENEFEPDTIWPPEVITRSRFLIASSWMLTCIGLAAGVGWGLLRSRSAGQMEGDPTADMSPTSSFLDRTNPMSLMTGVSFEEIWNALDEAFDDQTLRQMLRTRIDPQVPKKLAWTKPIRDICFDLLTLAEREGWHVRLIREAHRFTPGSAGLPASTRSMACSRTLSSRTRGPKLPVMHRVRPAVWNARSRLGCRCWMSKSGGQVRHRGDVGLPHRA